MTPGGVEVGTIAAPPGFFRAVWRGMIRRCARCGGGGLFRRWLVMLPDCPTCGMHFERVEGYWLGAVALNLVVTEGAFVVSLVLWMVMTWPDVPWGAVLAALIALNAVLPLAFHPWSRTIWVALERRFSGAWDAEPPGP
jgi:uncharacterized protein (DUF983 family)